MLYFTASWCGPCRAFTPRLVQLYSTQDGRHPVEVVLVSRDSDERSAAAYRSHQPWLSLPSQGRERADDLADLCGIRSIPRLVVFDARTGTVLSENAVQSAADYFKFGAGEF